MATGALRGDGRIGMATVTARTGTSDMATVDVEIGKFAANITLQASPGQVADSGGNVSLLAVVRDDQGRRAGRRAGQLPDRGGHPATPGAP